MQHSYWSVLWAESGFSLRTFSVHASRKYLIHVSISIYISINLIWSNTLKSHLISLPHPIHLSNPSIQVGPVDPRDVGHQRMVLPSFHIFRFLVMSPLVPDMNIYIYIHIYIYAYISVFIYVLICFFMARHGINFCISQLLYPKYPKHPN